MDLLKRTFNSEIKGVNEDERSITAYISTKARDRMDESLDPQGADITKYKKNPVVLWAHDYEKPPIGRAMWTKKDDKGIMSKVQFADTAFGREIFGLYKDGFMNAFSVGFIPKKWDDGDGKKTASRTYTDWEMLEYSAVPVPANPEALTLMVSKGIIDKEKVKTIDEATLPDKEAEPKEATVKKNENEIVALEIALKRKEEANDTLTKENSALRSQIYALYVARRGTETSEITVDEVAKQISDSVGGVIRQMQGKI